MFASKIVRRTNLSQAGRQYRPSADLRSSIRQRRSFGNKTNQYDPGLGGPGGQEIYPYSKAYHREYALETGIGVLLSGVALYYLKRFERFRDSISPRPVGKATILVHDDSKGVLDDVKMVRPEDLGKIRGMTGRL
ncbi:hypothetical protein QBC37DRAFT_65749 [Rhypophila decipiens]|uniref:Uncharacterized protein n=1 Tax=Rhypophila decipiens TaxID=261697 RepID=A0AAN7B3C5_9PEZI|nr:hypothetical protein QBC37DRAFT_65749 [Rhypophila decipiens]